jgi:hypothetical protein
VSNSAGGLPAKYAPTNTAKQLITDIPELLNILQEACKGNLTDLRRELHSSLAKGNPK